MLKLNAQQTLVADEIRNTFAGLGYSHAQICGLLAMALGESSLRPNVAGDRGADGRYHAFGLFEVQTPRCAAIETAMGFEMATASVADQCRGVDWELCGPEHVAGQHLKAALSPTAACIVLVTYYERPRDKQAAIDTRTPWALFFDHLYGEGKA